MSTHANIDSIVLHLFTEGMAHGEEENIVHLSMELWSTPFLCSLIDGFLTKQEAGGVPRLVAGKGETKSPIKK